MKMKTFKWLLIIFALTGVAKAQDLAQPTIIVVDVERVVNEAVASVDLRNRVAGERDKIQQQITQQEESLRATEQQLVKDRSTLSDEDFQKRRKDLEQQVIALQKSVESSKQQLNRILAGGVTQVQRVMKEIIAEIAQERRANLILDKSAAVLMSPDFEVTDETLKRLNERLPTLAQ